MHPIKLTIYEYINIIEPNYDLLINFHFTSLHTPSVIFQTNYNV